MSKQDNKTKSCIVNTQFLNLTMVSEEFYIFNSKFFLNYQDVGRGCDDYSRKGSLPITMVDNFCNNWQRILDQESRSETNPTKTLDIMLVEYFLVSVRGREEEEGLLYWETQWEMAEGRPGHLFSRSVTLCYFQAPAVPQQNWSAATPAASDPPASEDVLCGPANAPRLPPSSRHYNFHIQCN